MSASSPPRRSSGRARKAVTKFSADAPAERSGPVLGQGKGERLGLMPNVAEKIKAYKAREKFMLALYRVMYPGTHPRHREVKEHIRAFNGLADTSDAALAAAHEKLSRLALADIRRVADVLDVRGGATKAAITDAVVAFLEQPSASGLKMRPAVGSGVGAKRKKAGKKAGGGGGGVGGIRTSYMAFCTERRPSIVAANPGMPVTEIAKLMGAEWRALTDAEKQPYKDISDAAKAASGGVAPAAKRQRQQQQQQQRRQDESDEDDYEDGGYDDSDDDSGEEASGDEESGDDFHGGGGGGGMAAQIDDPVRAAQIVAAAAAYVNNVDSSLVASLTVKSVRRALAGHFTKDEFNRHRDAVRAAVSAAYANRMAAGAGVNPGYHH